MSDDEKTAPTTWPAVVSGISSRECLEFALANSRMAGLPDPSDDAMAILKRAAREEITFHEAHEQILANVKAQVRGEPLPFPAPPPEERFQEPDPIPPAGERYSVEAIKLLDGLEPVRRRPTHNIISDEE